MLDLPSGNQHDFEWSSQVGLDELPFSLQSEGMSWRANHFATYGALKVWDHENNSNTLGQITVTAAEGVALTSLAFDISGLKEFSSTVEFQVYLDGELFHDHVWNFNGNSTLRHRDWDFGTNVSEVMITMTNLQDGGMAYTGLDNIELGSMNIPAPGALALLGLAGLAGGRRRSH